MLKTLRNSLLRPLQIVVFLLALQASFTLWSQVGGQSHLDMVYWPWKLAVGLAAALLITAITASLVRSRGEITRRTIFLTSLLLTVAIAAGLLSYFSHLNEPDDSGDDEDTPAVTSLTRPEAPSWAVPNPTERPVQSRPSIIRISVKCTTSARTT